MTSNDNPHLPNAEAASGDASPVDASPVDAGVVQAYLHDRQPAFVAFLCTLARMESPSLEPATQQPVLAHLEQFFESIDYEVERLPGQQTGGHLLARPRRRDADAPTQLLLGHCDTVWPVGTLRTMPVAVDGGRVRGPGVFDMKGGLTQMAFALRALHDLQLTPPVTPVVLITSDEEIGSFESRPHIERLARQAGRALVLEPALGPAGRLKTARKGTGTFVFDITGKAAHAGLDPEAGASAILEMTYVVQHLFALNDPAHGVSVNVGTLDGGLRSNVIAPHARITVDVRVPTAEAGEQVVAAIRAITPSTPGVTLDVTGGLDRPPMPRTPRNQALWHLARRLGEALGLALEEGTSGGASDGNITSPYTATLDGLGAVGDGAHAAHEHLDLAATLHRCALLTLLLTAPPVPIPAATAG